MAKNTDFKLVGKTIDVFGKFADVYECNICEWRTENPTIHKCPYVKAREIQIQ